MNRNIILAIVLGTFLIGTALVFAYYVSWSASVTVTTTDPNIKVYWNSACTNLTTSIPIGNVQRGATKTIMLYVRNEGGGAINIYWNSTLSEQTNQITESWTYYRGYDQWWAMNGTNMPEGGVFQTRYTIVVSPTAPLQLYSWSLNVGGW